MHSSVHEAWHGVTHTNKGILRLLQDLTVSPGKTYMSYFAGARKKYFSPVVFFLLSFGVLLPINKWVFDLEDYRYHTLNEWGRYYQQSAKFKALLLLPIQNKDAIRSPEKMNTQFEKEIDQLEEKLEALLVQWQPEQVKNISSIKAIGKRATAMLIIFTQGFRYTENHRQLISFAGLSLREYSSGTSIHSRPMICKRGGKPIRDVLYMSAMNAIKTNTACKALYERLKAKGKSGKLALIAVCNKLLKQVFAVIKNNTSYQPNYCSAKP